MFQHLGHFVLPSDPYNITYHHCKIQNYQNIFSKCPFSFRHNNSQAFEHGYVNESSVESNHDFIIVLERMKESLAVLKNILCMDWSDVIPFYLKSLETKTNFMKKEEAYYYDLNIEQTDFIKNNLIDRDQELYVIANKRLDVHVMNIGGKDAIAEFDRQVKKYQTKFIASKSKRKAEESLSEDRKSTYFLSKAIYESMRRYMKENNGVCNLLN